MRVSLVGSDAEVVQVTGASTVEADMSSCEYLSLDLTLKLYWSPIIRPHADCFAMRLRKPKNWVQLVNSNLEASRAHCHSCTAAQANHTHSEASKAHSSSQVFFLVAMTVQGIIFQSSGTQTPRLMRSKRRRSVKLFGIWHLRNLRSHPIGYI